MKDLMQKVKSFMIFDFPLQSTYIDAKFAEMLQNPTKLTQLIRRKLTHHFAGAKLHEASTSLVLLAA